MYVNCYLLQIAARDFRMCPGRYFAQEALAIYVATVLQVFDISPGLDEFGNTKVLRTEVTGSLAAYVSAAR